jgi:hypothetical protein
MNTQILDVICKACHPGNMLPTKLFQNWMLYRVLGIFSPKFSKSIAQAAATPVYLATARSECFARDKVYWNNLCETDPSDESLDAVLAFRVWEISESLLIDITTPFDAYLRVGDKFSSISKIDTPNSTPSSFSSTPRASNFVE